MNKAKWLVLAGLVVFWGCNQADPPVEQTEQPAEEEAAPPATESTADEGIPTVAGDTITTASGMKYLVMAEGTGDQPTPGQVIDAHYTGWLTDGTKFDSSRDRGKTFSFPIGQGRVIKGWDEALADMKVGGRRLLIIPYELAYGERGKPPIPPKATLIFDVELVGIQ